MSAGKRTIAYYPGCAANFWEPEVGIATVRMLERNGYKVIVPKHYCCGIARIGYGDFKGARREAEPLINILYTLAREEYDIVATCPSCTMAIKEHYPFLFGGDKAKLVADKTHFLAHYLNKLDDKGELNRSFNSQPSFVAYHSPCHLKSHGLGEESLKLMALVPELRVVNLNRGCCGMSGTRGFKKQYFDSSLKIGKALFDRIIELKPDRVATDCSGCKLQIEQGAKVKAIHPIIILESAYRS